MQRRTHLSCGEFSDKVCLIWRRLAFCGALIALRPVIAVDLRLRSGLSCETPPSPVSRQRVAAARDCGWMDGCSGRKKIERQGQLRPS